MIKSIQKILLITIIGITVAGIVNASISTYWKTVSDIIPRTDNNVSIGSDAKGVKEGWFDDIYVTDSGSFYGLISIISTTTPQVSMVQSVGSNSGLIGITSEGIMELTDITGAYSLGDLASGGGGGYTNLTEFVDQTNWRVFYSDGSGDVNELALGTSGQYLKANGTTSAPTWDTPAGSSLFTASSGMTYLTDLTDDLIIGGTDSQGDYAMWVNTATNDLTITGAVSASSYGLGDDQFIVFDDAQGIGLGYSTAHGDGLLLTELRAGNWANLYSISDLYIASNTNADGGGDWVPSLQLIASSAVDGIPSFEIFGEGSGASLRTGLTTSVRAFDFPNIGGTIVTTSGAGKHIYLGAFNLTVDTDTLFVDADNNSIGINDLSPDSTLEMTSSGDDYFMISSHHTEDGNILWVDSAGDVSIGTVDDSTKYKLDVNGTTNFRDAVTGITLNEIENLTADKTFVMAANNLTFTMTSPSEGFTIDATGAFTDHAFHIHQTTGNPGTSQLAHFEADDDDVISLSLVHTGAPTQGYFQVGTYEDSGGDIFRIDTDGFVGIFDSAADSPLSIVSATTPQIAIATTKGYTTGNIGVTGGGIMELSDVTGAYSLGQLSAGGHDAITLAGTPDYITLANQVITRTKLDISDDTSATGGVGVDITANDFTFDATELTNLTWGSGSAITWTFDASAGVDGTIDFGNDLVNFGFNTIGINDPAPDAALEVVSAGDDYFMISRDADGEGNILLVDSAGDLTIGDQSGDAVFSWYTDIDEYIFSMGVDQSDEATFKMATTPDFSAGNLFEFSSSAIFTIFNGTSPTSNVTDGIQLYASDNDASLSELLVRDEAGNVTQLSPHKNGDWIFNSHNESTGKAINVEMENFFKWADSEFGTDFVQEYKDGERIDPPPIFKENETLRQKVVDLEERLTKLERSWWEKLFDIFK